MLKKFLLKRILVNSMRHLKKSQDLNKILCDTKLNFQNLEGVEDNF